MRFGMCAMAAVAAGVVLSGTAQADTISYHGGNVITSGLTIDYIWYGDWNNYTSLYNTASSYLDTLAQNLGKTAYWDSTSAYYQGKTTLTYISPTVTFGGQISFSDASVGKSIGSGTGSVSKIVYDALVGGKLPVSQTTAYLVLPSPDIAVSGLGTQFCGWHSDGNFGISSGGVVDPGLIGLIGYSTTGCTVQSTKATLSGNAYVDGMASVVAHEAEEIVTDPYLNAWYSSSTGAETGDLCAWNFGTTSTAANGAKYNETIGGKTYLLQQMYSRTTQSCTLSSSVYTPATTTVAGAAPVIPVPEPSTWLTVMGPMIALFGVKRRRKVITV